MRGCRGGGSEACEDSSVTNCSPTASPLILVTVTESYRPAGLAVTLSLTSTSVVSSASNKV